MKKIILTTLLLVSGASLFAGNFKFLANCNVGGKEMKGVHVHDIDYDTMADCEGGAKHHTQNKAHKIKRACGEKVKGAKGEVKFSLYCVKK